MPESSIGPLYKTYPSMKGYCFGAKSSAPSELRKVMDYYKVHYLKNMISLYPDDLKSINGKRNGLFGKLTVSIKRDGMFAMFSYDKAKDPNSIFCNTSGRAIYNLPINRQITKILRTIKISDVCLDLMNILVRYRMDQVFEKDTTIFECTIPGELIAKIEKAKFRPRVSDLMKLILNPGSLQDLKSVNFEPFDLITLNKVNLMHLNYVTRLDLLSILFPRSPKSHKIRTVKYFKNLMRKDILSVFEHQVIAKGQEGLVIRNQYGLGFKLKRVYEMDAVIIGFTKVGKDSRLKDKDAISTLLTALMDREGHYHVAAKIKAGLRDTQRIELYTLLSKDTIPSKYQVKSESSGKFFKMVKPKYVVQVRFLNLLPAESAEEEVRDAILRFDHNTWLIKDYSPQLQFLNPWFDGFRSLVDLSKYPSLKCINPKEPSYNEIKLEQLKPLVKRPERIKEEVKRVFRRGSLKDMYDYIRDGYLSDAYFTQEEIQELFLVLKEHKRKR